MTTQPQPAAEKATPHKWTSQRRFIAEPEHVMRKWGLAKESLLCSICRKRFKVGDGVRWVCATAHGFYNFFVCDDCDSPDVIEVWGRISRLAQQDEYELAAKIVKLESQSAAFDALVVKVELAVRDLEEMQRDDFQPAAKLYVGEIEKYLRAALAQAAEVKGEG